MRHSRRNCGYWGVKILQSQTLCMNVLEGPCVSNALTHSRYVADTVLVVDDTPETLSLLTDTLDQAGFTVLIATDGETALDLVDQVTPDLVLMDARMPGISGFETCKRLKRDKLLSHLPVIFMTGLSETEHVLEGLACGGVDYVTKPIVLDELLARMRVHLGNARVAFETHAALDASGRFLVCCQPRWAGAVVHAQGQAVA